MASSCIFYLSTHEKHSPSRILGEVRIKSLRRIEPCATSCFLFVLLRSFSLGQTSGLKTHDHTRVSPSTPESIPRTLTFGNFKFTDLYVTLNYGRHKNLTLSNIYFHKMLGCHFGHWTSTNISSWWNIFCLLQIFKFFLSRYFGTDFDSCQQKQYLIQSRKIEVFGPYKKDPKLTHFMRTDLHLPILLIRLDDF